MLLIQGKGSNVKVSFLYMLHNVCVHSLGKTVAFWLKKKEFVIFLANADVK